MIKLIVMLKKKHDISTEQFRDYYERVHAKIGEKYLKGLASRYLRNFLNPIPDRTTGKYPEPEHDVVTEIWFPDQNHFDMAMEKLMEPEAARETAEDQAKLFDCTKHRYFIATECISEEISENTLDIRKTA